MMLRRKFIEIAANLTDPMFQGSYHGSVKHVPDLEQVLLRSWDVGVDKIIITGTTLEESRRALEMSLKDDRLFCTVGCHPTHAGDFEKDGSDPDVYLSELQSLIQENRGKVVALGECGLDYDRLHFCDKPTQLKYFEKQLELSKKLDIPLFLHCRAAFDDFWTLIDKHRPSSGGVVHSFDGTLPDARKFIDAGFKIGLNGCSLKTQDNLDVASNLPCESILLETDCPWCEVRPTHAGFKNIKTKFDAVKKEKWSPDKLVKSRNEPANIVQILEILAAVKKVNEDSLCEQIYDNTTKTFFTRL
ncbi:hypothetical protein GE061_008047 [Apolygus lucorum]|uniref:Deoxyribonuclease TATDN1 n=1 Tax=Apolygus lucorum TaxID=248454 RepID=A0A8S9WQ38_APOLU|nr:hypothetical protein GE061_008047 [Apolygus lucorum]